ncbi:acetylserotonin O-methyltransferase [Prosthecodimorpha staleyi]|uniref:Methyltransferase domain-containing protein n=1 Tax=Prosthecodimorpha staleyi TaxID=2840188 RepID=A0A947D5A3_9HYPH|nr:acetylserotonin O-methyltransferase [Prosthecodimorpha staleyi]MBT9289841.1 methyltransferase domain-containing protein [Prosthecodimorpha staleyi]
MTAQTDGWAGRVRDGPFARLRDRLARWRNRLVESPRFQRFAADLPVVRRVASRHASDLFDLCAGFVYSQILLACVQLRLFDAVAGEALALDALALRLGLDPEPTARLADASVALGLLERRPDGRYGLGLLGAALRGNPGLQRMIEHHALFYRDLADPVALLHAPPGGTELAQFWPYAAGPGTEASPAAAYSELMASTVGFVDGDAIDAYDFGRHRRVLDVGGGTGGFLAALAARHPALDLVLFDLPPVARLAEARFAGLGLGHRARVVAGDFRGDPLPAGADLITLVRVLHDHPDEIVLTLLRAARAALAPGGRLLVAEPLAGTPGAERMGDAYFGFYLMAMGRGRPRSADALGRLLVEAGFAEIRRHQTRRPMLVSLLSATADTKAIPERK